MKNYHPCRKVVALSFGAADTSQSANLFLLGSLRHLLLIVPNFSNGVTATVTIADADGHIIYTSAAKAKNSLYNLEREPEWLDLLVCGALTLTVTLNGQPGGTGGIVTAIPVYFGEPQNS